MACVQQRWTRKFKNDIKAGFQEINWAELSQTKTRCQEETVYSVWEATLTLTERLLRCFFPLRWSKKTNKNIFSWHETNNLYIWMQEFITEPNVPLDQHQVPLYILNGLCSVKEWWCSFFLLIGWWTMSTKRLRAVNFELYSLWDVCCLLHSCTTLSTVRFCCIYLLHQTWTLVSCK